MWAVLKSENLYAVEQRIEIYVSPEFAKLFLESKTYSSNIDNINLVPKEYLVYLNASQKEINSLSAKLKICFIDISILEKTSIEKDSLINDSKRKY